jgi:hypothetical protein
MQKFIMPGAKTAKNHQVQKVQNISEKNYYHEIIKI